MFEIQNKNTENINPKISKTSKGKTMLSSKCALYDSQKWRFMKVEKEKEILSSLGIKLQLSKIPLFGGILL